MFFTSLPMRPKLRHDVAMATSRRSARHVATQRQTRRDVATATSRRNLKVKRRLKVKGL